MASNNKEYLVPIPSAEIKTEMRKWMGRHNGMSILRSDWYYTDDNRRHWLDDCYIIKITNPKTELLFCLSYPDAKDITGTSRENNEWRLLSS